MKELQTERLTIRTAVQDIVDRISSKNNTDHVTEYLSSLSHEKLDTIFQETDFVMDLISRLSRSFLSEQNEYYAAFLEDHPIGYIALVNCDSELPDLQIEIAPEYQGCGYGYEFLSTFLQALFEEGRYSCVQYTVIPSNKASLQLVNNVGAFEQKASRKAESLLVRTYHISKLSMDAYDAHDFCSNHKPELEQDNRCGCFYCIKRFHPSEIQEWIIEDTPIDWRGTAICPHCEIDAVIGESSGYPITEEFLLAMNRIWFT